MVLSPEKCVTSTELLDFGLLALSEVSPASWRVPVHWVDIISLTMSDQRWLC